MSDQTKPESPPAGETQQPTEAFGAAVGRGTSWILLGNVLGKAASFVAQVWLGHLLTDTDFGVFATASAIGWFLALMRDAGSNAVLLQRGPGEYQRLAGACFWLGMSFAAGSALLLGLAAYPIALAMHEPKLAPILWVIGAAGLVNTPASQLQTKLRQDLRFRDFTIIQTVSAVLRQVATVAFATMHLGAMSFAWPYLVCAAYELIAGYRATRETPWRAPALTREWGGLLRQGLWTVAGSAANFGLDQGPFFVLGLLTTKAITGQFFFAFWLTAQVGVLMSSAIQQVLAPVFVRLNDDRKRQGEAIIRALRAMMLASSVVHVFLSVAFGWLESSMWRGKWSATVLPVMILGAFYPWRATFGLTTAALQAHGRFKLHALLTAFEALGLMGVVALSARSFPCDVVMHALYAGTWLLIARYVVTSFFLDRLLGFPRLTAIRTLSPAWTLACGVGVLLLWLDHAADITPVFESIARPFESILPAGALRRNLHASGPPFLHACFLGLAYLIAFFALARFTLRTHLRDAVSVAPVRIRGLLASALCLGPP